MQAGRQLGWPASTPQGLGSENGATAHLEHVTEVLASRIGMERVSRVPDGDLSFLCAKEVVSSISSRPEAP